MTVTVVIPYRSHPDGVRRLLSSLALERLQVIVVDDASPDPIRLRRPNVRVLRLEQRGYFSGAVNAGIQAAAPDSDVVVMNQDIEITNAGWLDDAAVLAEDYALFGDGVFGHPAWPYGYVQGTLMYMRRDALEAVGLLDEHHWPLWGATAEWQVRACRLGFAVRPIRHTRWFQHERGKRQYGSAIRELLREQPERRGLYIRTPPLISVVTACYNYGRYLGDLVASLRGGETSIGEHPGQTFAAWELVIVDDASTDDSWELAQQLADPWAGIHAYRRRQNGGTARALNTAVRRSYGRYIYAVDADDMLEPQAVERMVEEIQRTPQQLLYSDLRRFGGGERKALWHAREWDYDELLERNMVPAGTVCSRQAWRDAGGFPESFARGRQDWAFAVAMAAAGHRGRRVPEALYLYRREGQNRSLTNTNPTARAEFRDQMEETFPELYQEGSPMPGCCGSRSSRLLTNAKRTSPGVKAVSANSVNGMVLVEYVGANTGRQYLHGPVTGRRYKYSGRQRAVTADPLDVDAMLGMVQDHAPMFRLSKQARAVPEEDSAIVPSLEDSEALEGSSSDA
jgi:glycosyltransferase involved in cell wall biosynthesis